jgi:S-formylglutathione hydrolase FrmB
MRVHHLPRHAVVVAAALICVAGSPAAVLHQDRDVDEGITSVALRGTVHARVILPASYDESNVSRYPVVYFLHGLPANAASYRGSTWLASVMAQVGDAILVLPQGARDSDTDPEYLNWGAGRDWETYIGRELPTYIDSHFRTIRSRAGRAIAGLSAGGYGATIVGLHNPAAFSVIESWSGYFHPTDPTGTKPLAREAATSAHTLVSDLRGRATYFAFYVGRADSRFLAENLQLDRELRAAGAAHVFEVYKGSHETALWQSHAVAWLRLALAHLAPATR